MRTLFFLQLLRSLKIISKLKTKTLKGLTHESLGPVIEQYTAIKKDEASLWSSPALCTVISPLPQCIANHNNLTSDWGVNEEA